MDNPHTVLTGDINGAFLERLKATFPEPSARWVHGEDVADVAFKSGQQNVIDWIVKHARITPR